MKKLNTTYLDNLVSKILKETLEERADDIVSKIKTESNNGQVCECGGNMYEGKCNECGGMYENMDKPPHDDPMNYNAAITGSYYESKEGDATLARIKSLALLK